MSDSSLPPGGLPPIPEGCGILPIAENRLHSGTHPELLEAALGSASPLRGSFAAASPAAFGDGTSNRDTRSFYTRRRDIESDDADDCDAMESHYRRVLARALLLCSLALLLMSAIAASMIINPAETFGPGQNLLAGQLAAKAIFITQLLFVAFCGRFVEKLSILPAAVLLFAYAAFCALEFSSLLPPGALAVGALCAGAMLAATALWGYVRRCDLARPATPIFMILAGGAILVAVNMALATPRSAWTFSSIAVVVFASLAGSHAQQIRDFYQDFDDDNAEGWKASLAGALLLLLNCVNVYLLVASVLSQLVAFVGEDSEERKSARLQD